MARTPEEKKAIAREFQEQFLSQPGRKALQRAVVDSGLEEPPVRPPRGKKSVHYEQAADWLNRIHRSTELQRGALRVVRENQEVEQRRWKIAERFAQSTAMFRIVADANVVLPGIGSPGFRRSRDILDLVTDGKLDLIVTNPIVAEIQRVANSEKLLRDLMFSPEQLDALDRLLSIVAINVSALPKPDTIEPVDEDPDDTKYVDALLRGRADYLVTQDGHLLNWEPHLLNLPIVPPLTLLDIVRRKL